MNLNLSTSNLDQHNFSLKSKNLKYYTSEQFQTTGIFDLEVKLNLFFSNTLKKLKLDLEQLSEKFYLSTPEFMCLESNFNANLFKQVHRETAISSINSSSFTDQHKNKPYQQNYFSILIKSHSISFLEDAYNTFKNFNIVYLYNNLKPDLQLILLNILSAYERLCSDVLDKYASDFHLNPVERYINTGFIGKFYSEVNFQVIRFQKAEKLIVALKEQMSLFDLHLYERCWHHELEFYGLVLENIGTDTAKTQLYAAKTEAARLCKLYMQAVHNLKFSQLILDKKTQNHWYDRTTKEKTLKHPLNLNNPNNIIASMQTDFVRNDNLAEILKLIKNDDSKYLNAVRNLRCKQRDIRRIIDPLNQNDYNGQNILRLLLNKPNDIDKESIYEGLNNLGITEDYIHKLESLTQSTEVDFCSALEYFFDAEKSYKYKNFDFILSYAANCNVHYIDEQGIYLDQKLFDSLAKISKLDKLCCEIYDDYFVDHEILRIEQAVSLAHKYCLEQGANQNFVKLCKVLVYLVSLNALINSQQNLFQVLKQNNHIRYKFFRCVDDLEKKEVLWDKYQTLNQALEEAYADFQNDKLLIWQIFNHEIKFIEALQVLTNVSKLCIEREKFYQSIIHSSLTCVEQSFLKKSIKLDSDVVYGSFARGGSAYDSHLMDVLTEILEIKFYELHYSEQLARPKLEYFKSYQFHQTKSEFVKDFISKQLLSVWNLRVTLYNNLHKAQRKDKFYISKNFKEIIHLSSLILNFLESISELSFKNDYQAQFKVLKYQKLWFRKVELLISFIRQDPQFLRALSLIQGFDKQGNYHTETIVDCLKEFNQVLETSNSFKEPLSTHLRFDLNGDGQVDEEDFAVFTRLLGDVQNSMIWNNLLEQKQLDFSLTLPELKIEILEQKLDLKDKQSLFINQAKYNPDLLKDEKYIKLTSHFNLELKFWKNMQLFWHKANFSEKLVNKVIQLIVLNENYKNVLQSAIQNNNDVNNIELSIVSNKIINLQTEINVDLCGLETNSTHSQISSLDDEYVSKVLNSIKQFQSQIYSNKKINRGLNTTYT
jgi:hypothetical protein